ncbi:MAG: 3-phosphoshikimate 1-carboxyvinyltransferase, partial [Longimicrobiales bacterium]
MSRSFTLGVPGDKSITHRALLLSSIANGESRIRGALDSADTRSTVDVLRALGVRMPPTLSNEFRVAGGGLHCWRAPARDLDCGNSGTTARLVMGALAGRSFASVLTGDHSLQSRPMRRVTSPLGIMGARFDNLGDPDRLPIRVRGGPLSPLD